MNRKDYFKSLRIAYIFFILLGIASLFANEGMSKTTKIGLPAALFAVPLIFTAYGLLKYKKQ